MAERKASEVELTVDNTFYVAVYEQDRWVIYDGGDVVFKAPTWVIRPNLENVIRFYVESFDKGFEYGESHGRNQLRREFRKLMEEVDCG